MHGAPGNLEATEAASLEALVAAAHTYRDARRSASTRTKYERDWATFTSWCASHGHAAVVPVPAPVVALYAVELAEAGRHPSTIGRVMAAITAAHEDLDGEPPTRAPVVRQVLSGIRRTHGVAPRREVDPVTTADVRRMVEAMPDTLGGVRDRALLLVGFASAMRRSELVSIDVEDLARTDDGLVIRLRRSKTDQEGEGRKLGVPFGSGPATCPVRAVRDWQAAAGIWEGPLWRPVTRHGRLEQRRLGAAAVAQAVKRSAARVGIEPGRVAGHSLRAGFATSAAAAGASERSIAAQTGHRSLQVLRRYIRDGSLFRENAATLLGL